MSRLFARIVRLLKIGAVAGAAVGVGKLILNRRQQSATTESSWPTIAETAARNGRGIDDAVPADASGAEAAAGDGPVDETDSGSGKKP
ncbi:MAG: hypothetical protein OXE79_00590 [Acidimicrobiaceae bacterium]|nr:hypothetical protein [Acidimicrobiaceae bacterium]MCY4176819.1 hypothetical protein [Acidimicrobiaceae bacterium]MCY4279147.1 hypothetical protein [Acidimicrobiaceae bacterium]MCY4294679.1 hypothetical protein [Acidimicrobiaceae bacterium]